MTGPRTLSPGPSLDALTRPGPRSLHTWLLRVPEHAGGLGVPRSLLDDQENERADAFLRAADRDRYIAAHVALRRLLGAYLDIEPAKVALVREPCPLCAAPHGRPAVDHDGPPLHFSLSHSADLVLFGFAASPVGVDVEAFPSASTVAEVATTLHDREQAELAALVDGERTAAFVRVWVRKEAYLKGTGTGLATDPATFYVGTGAEPASPTGWDLSDVPVDRGYAACAALRVTRSA